MTGIVCFFTAGRVTVINELTDYLKDDTETRQGLDIMDDQFVTFGSAKVMIQNIGFAQAQELAKTLEQVKGVSSVTFYEEDDEDEKEITDAEALKDVYNDASALFLITFETDEDDDEAKKSMANVREVLSDYDTYFYSTVDKDDAKNLKEDMKYILVILVIIIITVLLFTSTTYMEIP
ncbi:MAG: RND transporter, partial [Lachnospiraceae bacterium]|nr:RND transporter [Lachnospiraceae bacterium]